MVATRFRENDIYPAVESGELEIDQEGRIWRLMRRQGNRWTGQTRTVACLPRRAEREQTGEYLQVRVMFNGTRVCALAHRLVWRHFNGLIPINLTINHKNGTKSDNRPNNLELATYSDQAVHALRVLHRGRVDQFGERNAMVKLSITQVEEIRARRAAGELLRVIAVDYDVREQQISRIARGERRFRG